MIFWGVPFNGSEAVSKRGGHRWSCSCALPLYASTSNCSWSFRSDNHQSSLTSKKNGKASSAEEKWHHTKELGLLLIARPSPDQRSLGQPKLGFTSPTAGLPFDMRGPPIPLLLPSLSRQEKLEHDKKVNNSSNLYIKLLLAIVTQVSIPFRSTPSPSTLHVQFWDLDCNSDNAYMIDTTLLFNDNDIVSYTYIESHSSSESSHGGRPLWKLWESLYTLSKRLDLLYDSSEM